MTKAWIQEREYYFAHNFCSDFVQFLWKCMLTAEMYCVLICKLTGNILKRLEWFISNRYCVHVWSILKWSTSNSMSKTIDRDNSISVNDDWYRHRVCLDIEIELSQYRDELDIDTLVKLRISQAHSVKFLLCHRFQLIDRSTEHFDIKLQKTRSGFWVNRGNNTIRQEYF